MATEANELMSMDTFLALHDERLTAFESYYAARNPKPEYQPGAGVDKFTLIGLAILLITSMLVSGSRTVDVFGGGLFGLCAFAMLEVGMTFYAYWRALRSNPNETEDRAITNVGLFIAFAVSLSANVMAELGAQNLYVSPEVKIVLTLALAFSAPSLALIAGDKLGRALVAAQGLNAAAAATHAEALALWRAGFLQEWDKNKARWGVRVARVTGGDSGGNNGGKTIPAEITAESAPEKLVPPELPERPARVKNPRGIANAHYEARPEDLKIESAAENIALAGRLNISKTLLYEVRKEHLEQSEAANV